MDISLRIDCATAMGVGHLVLGSSLSFMHAMRVAMYNAVKYIISRVYNISL